MNPKQSKRSFLNAEGRHEWESTSGFDKKVVEIKNEIHKKYEVTLSSEKNWIRRLWIKIQIRIEIRKRIVELSSWKNLHLTGPIRF